MSLVTYSLGISDKYHSSYVTYGLGGILAQILDIITRFIVDIIYYESREMLVGFENRMYNIRYTSRNLEVFSSAAMKMYNNIKDIIIKPYKDIMIYKENNTTNILSTPTTIKIDKHIDSTEELESRINTIPKENRTLTIENK